MNGPISSRDTVAFLNIGCISEKCLLRLAGTWISHSTIPNRLPLTTADRISLSHIPFRMRWSFRFTLPLTFPHLHYLNVTSKIGCVFFVSSISSVMVFTVQSILILWFVAITTTVEITTVKLVGRLSCCTPAIHEEFAYTLYPNGGLMSNGVTGSIRYRCQPL